jgi:hypothetical protein
MLCLSDAYFAPEECLSIPVLRKKRGRPPTGQDPVTAYGCHLHLNCRLRIGPSNNRTIPCAQKQFGAWLRWRSQPRGNSSGLDWRQMTGFTAFHSFKKNYSKPRQSAREKKPSNRRVMGDTYVQASGLIFWGTLRGLRADSMVRTQQRKSGWRAAHASMAHDMPRSSCWPGGQL